MFSRLSESSRCCRFTTALRQPARPLGWRPAIALSFAVLAASGCPKAQPHSASSRDGGGTSADATPVGGRPDATTTTEPDGAAPSADGSDGSMSSPDGGTGPDDATAGPDARGGTDASMMTPHPERSCDTVVTYHDQPGRNVFIAGSFNGFQPNAERMTDPRGLGTYTATLALAAGLYPYKLVVEGNWILDPSHRYRAYDNGVENSGLRAPNCHEPLLEIEPHETRIGNRRAHLVLRYTEANHGPGPDPARFELMLRTGRVQRALTAAEWSFDAAAWELTISLVGLSMDKHTVSVVAKNRDGTASNPVLLPFWIESAPFDWRDAIIYMAMTDRFRDGDPTNNPPPTPEAVRSGDYFGGDLQGMTLAIREGYLDQLGVKALWLTPFNTQPNGAYPDSDGIHRVTGYHGYWPIEARQVDGRIGGDDALLSLTETAHQHGIRVLMDFVANHVHENHRYVPQHPDWFRTQAQGACICGTANCDWTVHRLDCLFAAYLPNVVWQNNDAAAQFIGDAVYWLDHFDLDGLRIDAVKHVPDVAIFNLATQIGERFETAGTKYYLVGETAMGWYDCNPADPTCNADNYGTISRYIGDHALTGQFDFVLFHGTVVSVFASDTHGMIHADVWSHASNTHYPRGAIMGKYIGSHDESRFVTKVSQPQLAGNKWPDQQLATRPTSDLPYRRLALAHTWNMTIPGAPLLYFGDEYGEFGSSDPDNRHMMRFSGELNANEAALDATVKAIGLARLELLALRRGELTTLGRTTETLWVYQRAIPGTQEVAVVAINKSAAPVTEAVTLSPPDALPMGTLLHDRVQGSSAMVGASGEITITVPGYSSAIFAP